jgi:hypothetical protein
MENIIQSITTPTFQIAFDGQTKAWTLCLDYRALAKIEELTGRDLKKIEGWKNISSGKEFPQIIWACLHRYSPAVTLEDVLDFLNPQAQRLLSDALFELTFPGLVESMKEESTSPNATPAVTTP